MDTFKDILPSILQTKQNVLENPKDYVPFLVNRALSYQPDCLLIANVLNALPQLDKQLQYLVLLNTVEAKKRPYVKWSRPEPKDLQAVKMYFGYNDAKAVEAMKVLTKDQLAEIIRITTVE